MVDEIEMSDVAGDVAADVAADVVAFLAADTTDVLAADTIDVLSAAKDAEGVLFPAIIPDMACPKHGFGPDGFSWRQMRF